MQEALHGAGVTFLHAADCEAAWEVAWQEPFDLAMLNVMLPGDDEAGFHLREDLREAGFRQPILFLSARDAVPDRVRGLGVGDDYLPKPFALDELSARIRALSRRGEVRSEIVRWRDVEVRILDRWVLRGGAPVKLTTKEFEVLTLLPQSPGRAVTASRSPTWTC